MGFHLRISSRYVEISVIKLLMTSHRKGGREYDAKPFSKTTYIIRIHSTRPSALKIAAGSW